METKFNASQSGPGKQVESRGLAQAVRALSTMIQRSRMGALFGEPFGGKRNLNEVFGWPETISLEDIMKMYNRGGIAKRLVHAYPDACWGRPPEVYVSNQDGNVGDPAWDIAWKAFTKKHKLWQTLYRLDVLAGLGRYGVLLIGTSKGALNSTIQGEVVFLQPYGEYNTNIMAWDSVPTSPNFGKPSRYRVKPNQDERFGSGLASIITPSRQPLDIDYSRVIHVTHGTLEDEVFGRPIYADVYDYLSDLRKVVGSSAESYWLLSNRGLNLNVDKEMELRPEDEADLTAEADEYIHGFRRFMRTRGVEVKSLEAQIADPKGAFDVLITLIAGARGIPKRILLGSEAGQLASGQDKGNWAERVEEYRELHAEPYVLGPFIDKMIAIGALPQPANNQPIVVDWPDAYRMSPLERGQTAAQTARTIANVYKGMEPPVVGYTQAQQEVPGQVGPDGAVGAPSTQMVETPVYGDPLITREEGRAIIGLSTDNKVMSVNPKV